MRNFKKLTSVVLALAIVLTSMTVAFAATTTVNESKAIVLNKLDLYAGTSTSSFVPSLETELTRGQGAILLTKLFNMDDAALALTDAQVNAILTDFEDASEVPTYAAKRLAYLVQQNIMSGSLDNGELYINADESLLGGQFATLLLKQMGFTVDSWKASIAQLSNVAGAKDIATYLGYAAEPILRDHAVGIMYGSLTAKYSNGAATIIEKIVEAKPALKDVAVAAGLIVPVVPTELSVASVQALNLKQVQIVFNKVVDKTAAEKIENYYAYNGGATTNLVTGGSAALQADGKTVIVTLGSNFNNGTTAKVVVKNIAAYTNEAVPAVDINVPTVVGVTVTGPQTVTVEYSEPIYNIANAEYTVDNGNYIVTNAVANGSNKVDVTVGVNFTNGEHTLKINGTNVTDYAGYKAITKTMSFTVAADTTAPTVSVKSVTPTQVKLTFSKPVVNAQNANVLYRHTFNSNIYEMAGTAPTVTVNSSTEITLNWTAMPISLGANKLYIAYSTDTDTATKIQDLWGNKLAAVALDLTVTMDVVKPTVSSVEFVDASTLKVTFSETVDATTAQTASNYVIKDSAGAIVAINTPVRSGDDNNIVTLTTTTANALAGGKYTLEISKVKDTALVPNVMDAYASTLNITDTVRPTLAAAKYLIDNTTDLNHKKVTVYVPFNEAMNTATLVKANFLKVVNGITAVLGDNDTVTVAADGKSVIIVIDNGTTAVTTINVIAGAVKDVAGNGLLGFTANANPTADAIAMDKVEAIAKKQIKVTFDGRLSAVSATGYSLYATTTDTAISLSVASHTVNNDGQSEVIFNLGTELTADAKVLNNALTLKATTASGTKSFLGTVLSDNAGVAVQDKIVASIVSVTVTSGSAIEIVFDEAIEASTLAATLNGFSVTGGDAKLTAVAMKDGVGVDGTTIVLTGTGFVANQTTVTYNSVAGIADIGLNKIADFIKIAN